MKSTNVTGAKPKTTGAVFIAPVGTQLPTDATTALSEAFKSLGYVSKDGVTNSNSPSSESTTAWGGDVVLEDQTDKPDNFKFTLVEALNENVLKLVYGDDNVTGTLAEGIAVKANRDEAVQRALVIDMINKGAATRIVVPMAKVTELDDIVYQAGKPVSYGVKLAAYPDAQGQTHYQYTKAVS